MKKAVVLFSIALTSTQIFADDTSKTNTVTSSTTKQVAQANQDTTKTVTVAPEKNDETIEEKSDKKDDKKDDKKYAWMDAFSGTFTLTSNYVFRGFSQTENLPAVQGGLTYTLPLGLYLNVWGSNVKFVGTDATLELDTIAGIRGDFIKDVFSYDINIDRYNYPSARQLEYNELNSVFNIYFIQLGYSYSANAYNSHTTGTYYTAGISTDIPEKYFFGVDGFSVLILVGRYNLSCKAGCAYTDYNVGISKKLKNYTLTAQWTDTNHGQHAAPFDTSHFIGTLTADF